MWKMTKFLKGYRIKAFSAPLFKLLEAIFELIVPLVVAQIIDKGIPAGDKAYVLKMGGIIVALGITGLISSLTCQYFASVVSLGAGTKIRSVLWQKISSFSPREMESFGVASLVTRINTDSNMVQLTIAMFIRLVFRAPFLAIGATVMAMLIDLKMSLIFLLASLFIALIMYFIMSRTVPFYKSIQKLIDRLSLILRENLEGARVIRAFSRQKNEIKRFEKDAIILKNTAFSASRLSALLNPLTFLITNAAIIAIVWFGGIRVEEGSLTQGEVIALWNYMTQILLALIVVAQLVVITTKGAACAARVHEVLDSETGLSDEGNLQQRIDPAAPLVEFKNVSFSYGGEAENLLENISFKAFKGQSIGIIGGTGSGKSTLIELIPRFLECTQGEVLVGGVNVKKFPFAQLRGMMGIAPQKSILFTGTIRKNISLGKKDATDEEIKAALKTAQIYNFISGLPNFLDTEIVQGGKNFSGGQRQRLAIARAALRKPAILILDDSTSALDFATEMLLRESLKECAGSDSVFIKVSQRISTIKDSDLILVMENGEVIAQGKHDDLFDSCELYREICLSQLNGGGAVQ